MLEALEERRVPSVAFLGVAAGDATSGDAVLWTRAQDSATTQGVALTALVSTDPGFGSGQFYTGTTDPARDYTLKIDATGLQSGTTYYYRFLATGGALSGVGTFKTAPAPTANVAVHFGFSGDADGQWRPYGSTGNDTAPGVPTFAQQNFDYFVWLGDTIYETASTGSPATADPFTNPTQALQDYWRKYREQLQPVNAAGFPGLQTFFDSAGHYTLLDNHETGNKQFQSGGAPTGTPAGAGVDGANPANDVNTTGSYMNQTTGFQVLEQAYTDYQPIRVQTVNAPDDPRSNGTQQLYFAQQWGANSIFFNLDDRSYRDIRLKTASGADDTGARADNPDRTMLGATQLNWFEQSLLDAQAQGIAWKFVAVSSPIDQIGPIGGSFTATNADGSYKNTESDGGKSWMGGYRSERNQLLKFIADNHIDHVVFLTTDDHQVRINELGYFTDSTDPSTSAAYQASYTRVPGAFQILVGPIGAGGPDTITDHSFANVKSIADSIAGQQQALGIDPLGLDPNFPGLQDVYREGDPNANDLRQAVDFFSPDTFNYATLDVDPSGQHLTVKVFGINSYAANTFPEPSAANPVREILQFTIATGAADLAASGTGTFGGTAALTATLTDADTGVPLASKLVSFDLAGGFVGSATTDESGTATLTGVNVAGFDPGAYTGSVTAHFAGDESNLAADGTGTLTVVLPDPGVYVNGTELTIVGSDRSDFVSITPAGARSDGSTGLRVRALLGNQWTVHTYVQSFSAVRAYLGDGNDDFEMARGLSLPAYVTDGNGNDTIRVGDGDNVIRVGTGYDRVFAGAGNNTVTVAAESTAGGYFQAGDGDNDFSLGGSDNRVVLGDGNNIITAGNGGGFSDIRVGDGNNHVTVQGDGRANVRAGSGQNVIELLNSGFSNLLVGGGHNLIVNGLGPRAVNLGRGESIVVDGTANVQSGYALEDVLNEFVANLAVSHDLAQTVVKSRLQVDVPNTSDLDLIFGRARFEVILKGI